MYTAPNNVSCATTLVAASDMGTPKNALSSRLNLNKHSAFHRCGASSMVQLVDENHHLVKTAPKLPDALDEEESEGHCFPLTRLPVSRLRMRPLAQATTAFQTPTVSFTSSVDSTDEQQASGLAEHTLLPPSPARFPPNVMLPVIPSSESAEGSSSKFVLKPKPLPSSFQPIVLTGTFN